MKAEFLEMLVRNQAAAPAAVSDVVKKADAVCADLAALLATLDPSARAAALAMISQEVAGRLADPAGVNGATDGKLPPSLLEWARRTFNEDEFLAGVREIRATGGLEFEDFVKELERAAGEHE
jgi:hypothetical protein